MTAIDSTVIPEHLAEEYVDAVVSDGETYVTNKLSKPKVVLMTAQQIDATAIPSYTISDRTITFSLTGADNAAIIGDVAYGILIKGRK